MVEMFAQALKFARDDRGTVAVEYSLIAFLVSVSVVGGASFVGAQIGNMFNTIGLALAF